MAIYSVGIVPWEFVKENGEWRRLSGGWQRYARGDGDCQQDSQCVSYLLHSRNVWYKGKDNNPNMSKVQARKYVFT